VGEADPDALAVYCNAVADYQRAQQVLDQTGDLIQGTRGTLVRNPLNPIKAQNATVIRALSRQLGLSGPRAPEPEPARRRGRVERALDRDLGATTSLQAGARAHLRAQARAIDTAEALGDPEMVSKASHAYLELRQAYGLAGATVEAVDPFAAFVAGLSAPSMGDPAHS
jgi:hypothetical protein